MLSMEQSGQGFKERTVKGNVQADEILKDLKNKTIM